MPVAELLVHLATAYCIAGFLVALIFLTLGIDRIEPGARGAYAFRPLLVPGITLLWPYVLWRWRMIERQKQGRDER